MENKKIVVFGCDNTGKTTLCNYIKDRFEKTHDVKEEYSDKIYIAKSIGPNKTVDEYIDFMKDELLNGNNVIFDRFPVIEEYTCGNVLRHKNIFEGELVTPFFKMVNVFIFCYPGLFNTLNWGEREQMDGVKENAVDLINAYNLMAYTLKSLGYNVIEYNYKVDTMYDVYKKIFN